MKTIFKIEASVRTSKRKFYVHGLTLYTDKDIHAIEKEVLPAYIEQVREQIFDRKMIHHLDVTEVPVGVPVDDDEFITKRVYLPDSSLYIACTYRNLCGDSKFLGRKYDEYPMANGDICEVFINGRIIKGVIYAEPPALGAFKNLDAFDDSYTVLVGLDELPDDVSEDEYMRLHEHYSTCDVFPPM
jgi:hypothetical protein